VSSGFRAAPVSARRKRSLRLAKDSLNETPRALARKLHRSSPPWGGAEGVATVGFEGPRRGM